MIFVLSMSNVASMRVSFLQGALYPLLVNLTGVRGPRDSDICLEFAQFCIKLFQSFL